MVLRFAYGGWSAGEKTGGKWTFNHIRSWATCTITSESQGFRDSEGENQWSILIRRTNRRRHSIVVIDWWWSGFEKEEKNSSRSCLSVHRYRLFTTFQTWNSDCYNSSGRSGKSCCTRTWRLLHEKGTSTTITAGEHCFYVREAKREG